MGTNGPTVASVGLVAALVRILPHEASAAINVTCFFSTGLLPVWSEIVKSTLTLVRAAMGTAARGASALLWDCAFAAGVCELDPEPEPGACSSCAAAATGSSTAKASTRYVERINTPLLSLRKGLGRHWQRADLDRRYRQ